MTMNGIENCNDETLVRRCQANDMKAYQLIFRQYKQPLLRTAMRMLGDMADAEDAVQMTFLKLHRGIKKFRFQSKFSTYLFRILINTCFDHLKKQKKTDSGFPDYFEPSHSPKPELKHLLEREIDKLPDRMRACFVLFAVEEFRQKDIANILGLSTGTVKANIFHAKSKMRAGLSRSGSWKEE